MFYLETCRCPEMVFINYYALKPYVHYSKAAKTVVGVFPQFIDDMVSYVCGICQRASGKLDTKIGKLYDGRGTFAEKKSAKRAIKDIDDFTDLTFPIIAHKNLDIFMGYPYVSLIDHPGIVMLAKDKSINEIVTDMMMLIILSIGPLVVVNVLMMIAAGFLIWALVSVN